MPTYPYTLSGATTGSGSIPSTFAGVAHETDHAGYGLDKLLAQYADTPRLRGLLDILLDGVTTIGGGPAAPTGVQAIEDLGWELLTERFLHVVEGVGPAVGVQLDAIGEIVGLERNAYAATDAVYRELLKIKMLVNLSDGRLPTILDILERLNFDDPIVAFEYFPAAFQTQLCGVDADPAGVAIWGLVQHAKPAGVRWDFLWSTYSETDIFTYAENLSATTTDTARGYGNLALPPTAGGHYMGMSR